LLTLAGFLALHLIVPHVPKDVHRVFLSAYSVATGLLLMAIVLGDGPIQRVLRRPMLVMIGKLSYGIYLVHILALHLAEKIATPGTDNPLVSIAALLLAYLFSVCAAYLLAMAIERPGIALGRRISRRLIGTGAAR
jgi:peptidoglycan/LPS O-acetylase OafA/YrhL